MTYDFQFVGIFASVDIIFSSLHISWHSFLVFSSFQVLLAKKSKQYRRRISVLRGAEAETPPASASATVASSMPTGAPAAYQSNPLTENENSASGSSGNKIDIIAPAGKLGVGVDSSSDGGAAFVNNVKDHSPLKGEIQLGDRVIAIDGEDVTGKSAVDISSESVGGIFVFRYLSAHISSPR